MYYLHHYFDPDFSHLKLSPREAADGSVDYRYLGYVQNVVAGQVLAEIVDLDEHPDIRRDPRFIYPHRHLPNGSNCVVHPENPDRLIAAVNGYCFYHQGRINVKKLLNVRGNVGFHTGNIFFVGDLAVHGDVQTGFSLRAANILIKGHMESGKVNAQGDIVCLAGVKGASCCSLGVSGPESESHEERYFEESLPSALLDAAGTIRLPFCENVQLRAKGNIIIDGSCLHSTIYAGGNLIIKGRLQGGSVYANKTVYVGQQLGSDYASPTRIFMGYSPFEFLHLQKIESSIRYLMGKSAYFRKQAGRNEVMEQEYRPRLELVTRKLAIANGRREGLWRQFAVDEENAPDCRVIVSGKIMPGCEISIARAFYRSDDILENGEFMLRDEEVVRTAPSVPFAGGRGS